ncbi:hypothetical protein BKA82DRAFT_4072795 [Pisolithus tinctorius]|nr:hypothetical protein BKA82DRAFT_4072795 [Pisolithus tinctorius]
MASTDDVSRKRKNLERYPPGEDGRDGALFGLAYALYERYQAECKIDDLNEAIDLLRAALELRPVENERAHPHRDATLDNLATYLKCRFEKQAAIELKLRPPRRPRRDSTFDNLATYLKCRSILLLRAELKLRPPGHPLRDATLYGLAFYLKSRFDKQAAIGDLDEAISLLRAALELRPPGHPHRDATLHSLATYLKCRFDKQAAIGDLDEAISLLRAELELRPPRHPDRDATLDNLATYLKCRFDKQAAIGDLDEAISLLRAQLRLRPPGHPDRDATLYGLALYLKSNFDKQAVIGDLDEAISLSRAALELRPPGHPDRDATLHNLSIYLRCRFDEQAAIGDLDEAISLLRAELELRPLGHPDRGKYLYHLACDLWTKFQKQVDMPGLHGANSLNQTATADLASSLLALSLHLWDRLEKEAAMTALDAAICYSHYEGAWVQRPAQGTGSNEPIVLVALVNYFVGHRSGNHHAIVGLNEDITLCRYVLQSFPTDHPGRASPLHSLAQCLAHRFRQQPAAADLDEAIALEQEALELLLPEDPAYQASRRSAMMSSDAPIIRNVAFETLKTTPTRLLYTPTGILCNRDAQCKQLQMHFIHTNVPKHFQYATLSHRWDEDAEPFLPKGGFGKLQAFCRVALDDTSAEVQETIGSMFAWYRQSALTIIHLADCSEWFKRGWTLQELLAPKRILFYTQNWSLYKNLASSNHKTDVASRFLLQWSSLCRTTRPEDIAYSLFGIFNLHLPKALGRLLGEIISQSGDVSVLDWVGEVSPFHSCFPAHITSYQMLPLPPAQPNADEQSLTMSSQSMLPFGVLQWLRGSLTTSHFPQFLSRPQSPSGTAQRFPAIPLHTPDSYAPRDVYDFHSLTRVPLPRFLNPRLILPCIAHCVTVVHLKGSDPSAPIYTYNIQASGLRPLEITLPNKLEDEMRSQGSLQLVRPWHSKLPGSSAELDAVTEEQLLSTLERPFNALLLSQLPHDEHRRIASSIRITAQPIDRASILKSKTRIFNIV